ncbi:hypothetical protein HGB25_00575 [Candidatus Saccharibacteria bacterium]|nr:hypothetical protein [Candidatus Saccharibacteria bacterium]
MNTDPEKIKQGYRNRLHVGDVVYLVDESNHKNDSELVVKKATVARAGLLAKPVIRYWPYNKTEPPQHGVETHRDPKQLFTEPEVRRVISQSDSFLNADWLQIDELAKSRKTKSELAVLLGGATLARMTHNILDIAEAQRISAGADKRRNDGKD